MTKNLTAGSPVKLIILFTLPLLIGNLFQQLYAVADTLVVGRMLGVDALAAVGASGSLQFLLFGFAMGASTGMGIPVARAFGSGDLRATRRAVAAGAIISATIATAISTTTKTARKPPAVANSSSRCSNAPASVPKRMPSHAPRTMPASEQSCRMSPCRQPLNTAHSIRSPTIRSITLIWLVSFRLCRSHAFADIVFVR